MDSADVHERWIERAGEYSPDYYADMGSDETSDWLYQIFDRLLDRDAAILEVGCSAGRHLAYLHERGYENLHGVDINDEARTVMEETFPDLAATGSFRFDAIEEVVTDFADDQFDAVFSVETLQHVPEENEWVFEELARITEDVLVTVENEGDEDDVIVLPTTVDVETVDDFPLYHRTWEHVFTELGLVSIDSAPCGVDTLRVFRQPEAL